MTQTPPSDPGFPASTPPPPPPPPPGPTGPTGPTGPPPGYGTEPPPPAGFGSPPPAPGKKKNTPLIVVLAVLVVAAVAGGAFLLTNGGDDDDKGSNGGGSTTDVQAQAEDAALDFINAEVDEDCDAMVSLMSSRAIEARGGESEAYDTCVSEYEGYGGVTYEEDSLKMTSSGDETVTFSAEETLAGDPYEATYNLIKENGKWKVDNLG